MQAEVKRLGAEHYDEIIGLMNYVFGRQNKREMDFERELPKMCVRDDEHMRKHFGVFQDGRLVSCIGVYPYETVIGGEKFLFATMGNLVTHPDYEGKGYMSLLLERAVRELDDLQVDVARLRGLRSRYNRYGFETCGQRYTFTFTEKERVRNFAGFGEDITFSNIEATDTKALAYTIGLYNANAIALTRDLTNAYATLTAWKNQPYLALRNGVPVGYISVDSTGIHIAEVFAQDTKTAVYMLCAWQKQLGKSIAFFVQPHQSEIMRLFLGVCGSYNLSYPSQFRIRGWERLLSALIRLKESYCQLPKGELCIEIENRGRFRLFVGEGSVGCERTERQADIVLDELSAMRYLFGPFSPVYVGGESAIAGAWLPLPLSWGALDAV